VILKLEPFSGGAAGAGLPKSNRRHRFASPQALARRLPPDIIFAITIQQFIQLGLELASFSFKCIAICIPF
jgi:hypothetical protein